MAGEGGGGEGYSALVREATGSRLHPDISAREPVRADAWDFAKLRFASPA